MTADCTITNCFCPACQKVFEAQIDEYERAVADHIFNLGKQVGLGEYILELGKSQAKAETEI